MKKGIGAACVVGGLALAYFGYQAKQAVSSQVTELFTGNPSRDAMMMLVGGAALAAFGLGLLLKGGKSS